MPRLFLGIFCPSFILDSITPLLDELDTLPNCSATKKDRCHVTLYFFGEVDSSTIPCIIEKTQSIVTQYKPFPVSLEHLNTFGYRIIYLHAKHPSLIQLIEDLAMEHGVLDHKSPTIPHITLARQRISFNHSNTELLTFLNNHQKDLFGTFMVKKICLIQSLLTATGPTYTIIHEFKLLSPPTTHILP